MSYETAEDSFTRFAISVAPRLNQALISIAGDAGRDAASESLLWLVDGEGEVLATLGAYGPVAWNTVAGILDEDQGMHGHPDSLPGVTLDIEGNTFEQRWPRSVLEQKFSLVGLDAIPEDLEWFVTTGAGMHGPEWFDRCPDNLGHG